MTAEARLLQQASKQARDRAARFEVSPGKEQPWDARRFGKGGTRPFVVRENGRTGEEGKERAMKKGLRGLACLLAPAVLLLGLPAGASAETWTATWTSASGTPWEGAVTNGSVILVAERYSSLYINGVLEGGGPLGDLVPPPRPELMISIIVSSLLRWLSAAIRRSPSSQPPLQQYRFRIMRFKTAPTWSMPICPHLRWNTSTAKYSRAAPPLKPSFCRRP